MKTVEILTGMAVAWGAVIAMPTGAESAPRSMRVAADVAIIQNLLANSALSADTGDSAAQAVLYADDAIMDVGGSKGEIRGRDAIVALINDAAHMQLRASGMAHVAALPHVRVNGARAVAVGYLQIMTQDRSTGESAPTGIPSAGKWVTWRLTANRWDFALRAGRWQVIRRTIRPAPSAEALALLRLD